MTPKRRLAGLKAENSKRSKSRRTQRARRYCASGDDDFQEAGSAGPPGCVLGGAEEGDAEEHPTNQEDSTVVIVYGFDVRAMAGGFSHPSNLR